MLFVSGKDARRSRLERRPSTAKPWKASLGHPPPDPPRVYRFGIDAAFAPVLSIALAFYLHQAVGKPAKPDGRDWKKTILGSSDPAQLVLKQMSVVLVGDANVGIDVERRSYAAPRFGIDSCVFLISHESTHLCSQPRYGSLTGLTPWLFINSKRPSPCKTQVDLRPEQGLLLSSPFTTTSPRAAMVSHSHRSFQTSSRSVSISRVPSLLLSVSSAKKDSMKVWPGTSRSEHVNHRSACTLPGTRSIIFP